MIKFVTVLGILMVIFEILLWAKTGQFDFWGLFKSLGFIVIFIAYLRLKKSKEETSKQNIE